MSDTVYRRLRLSGQPIQPHFSQAKWLSATTQVFPVELVVKCKIRIYRYNRKFNVVNIGGNFREDAAASIIRVMMEAISPSEM
jgi:hypothetical protein